MSDYETQIKFDDNGFIEPGDNESAREFLAVIRRVFRTIQRCYDSDENTQSAGLLGVLRIATLETQSWNAFSTWTDEAIYRDLVALESRVREDPDREFCA